MTVNYASFGHRRRLAASFLDGFIIGIVSFVIGLIIGLATGVSDSSANVGGIMAQLVSLFISFSYYIYFIGSKGQTLGKMALGIKVVKITTSQVPGHTGAFLREIVGKFLSSLVLGLGYLWMLWDDKKQTWHDKIAGTIVVRV